MPTRSLTVVFATVALLFAACSGSPTVAEVNGESITAADVNALSAATPDELFIPGEPFRDALGLLIVNVALRTAAEEQFGFDDLNDADRLAARIADPPTAQEVSAFRSIEADPQLTRAFAEGAAENYTIRDAVVGQLATDESQDESALDQIFFAWREQAVDATEISVRSQVGIWGGLAAGVLPPP